MTNSNRRSFVAATAAVGTLGVAGCLSSIEEWGGGNGDDDSDADSNGDADDSDDETTPFHYADPADLPGETINSFDTLDDWVTLLDEGDFEADEDDPYSGSQSARLTAPEGTEYAGIYRTISGGTDLSDSNLSLAVKFAEQDQLTLTLELFAPNSNIVHRLRRTLVGPNDSWTRVDFGTTDVDGNPDLSSVREIRLSARRRGSDSGPIECSIDDLRTAPRPDTGKVMLLFNGTLQSHHEIALEHLSTYDFTGVEAVIPEAVGNDDNGRLSLSELDELAEAGWDLAARPRTGSQNITDFSAEEQERVIEQTAGWLETRGFEDGAGTFITPRNVLGPTTRELVQEYHDRALRYGGSPNALPISDPYNLGFFSGEAGATTRTYVDHAEAYGQLAVLHFEEIGPDGMAETAFEDLLEYIDAADVDVVTASELSDA
ncbi:polysaccharide deacetylase family protein [Natrialba asiatica]|uniref:Polysaccharide deacetylase n=1 Tax=Natrialba asiatica (strain ATCC 700177 / DSM 12278 / JCM 9576 / FERM P-10747 / NBRC 102637 / 172P1) TaxID=29540 RepID=M0AQ52_NATA1|nr:hypothetical protein [Natrialba asiatica]ELZ00861.1 hypothetical protein C481_11520 [Natrialba asiatica DSM 12278]